MKKIYLIGIVCISFLFASCETKLTEFSVSKRINEHFTFNDADGMVDTSFVFKGLKRSQLDISDKAVIKDISIRNIKIKTKGLPGNVSKTYTMAGYIKFALLSNPYPVFSFSEKTILEPNTINLAAKNYLDLGGIHEINKFLKDNLILEMAAESKFYLTLTPFFGGSDQINLDFDVTFELNIQYTDCFVTGNLGSQECEL